MHSFQYVFSLNDSLAKSLLTYAEEGKDVRPIIAKLLAEHSTLSLQNLANLVKAISLCGAKPGDELFDRLQEILKNYYVEKIRHCDSMNDLSLIYAERISSIEADFTTFQIFSAFFHRARVIHEKHVHTKDDISFLLSGFLQFLRVYLPDEVDKYLVHKCVIEIMEILHVLKIAIHPVLKITMKNCLSFDDISACGEGVFTQLLICAKTGLNIHDFLITIHRQLDHYVLSKDDISQLLFACYLFDATTPKEKTPSDLINNYFARIASIYANELFDKQADSAVYHRSLFQPAHARFSNGALREVQIVREVLQAAAFYQYQFNQKLTAFFVNLLKANTQCTVSPMQNFLFQLLRSAFLSNRHIEVVQEGYLLDCFPGDIVIRNKATNQIMNVEVDGLHYHYLINPDFTTCFPLQLVIENEARDVTLKKSDVKVLRFTAHDLENWKQKSPAKLHSLIEEITGVFVINKESRISIR